jgi:hypothetical protein
MARRKHDPRDVTTWTTANLNRYCGGPASGRSALGAASKMPGKTYGLPAAECITGTKLRSQAGSVCEHCYAFERGQYRYRTVIECQYRRLESITRPLWADALAELIRRSGERFFRLHDAGDIQGIEHLAAICRVARLCPDVKFWLPTREYRIVGEYRKSGRRIPANLTIRMSGHTLGGRAPKFPAPLTVSTVHSDAATYPGAHICPAPLQDNNCGDCRACWDRSVPHVSYHAH